MTKYILNSGGLRNNEKKATKFYNEILKELGNNPNVLYCFFAGMREDWENKFTEYTKNFVKLIDKNIRPILKLAMPDEFVEQTKWCDAVIIHGGDDHLLQYWLKQFDLPEIWKDKVVAVSSASSDALSESFWPCDWRKCMDGLGILPIKFISHYKSNWGKDDPRGPIDWQNAYDELAEYGNKSLPIYALEEGDYVIFEK